MAPDWCHALQHACTAALSSLPPLSGIFHQIPPPTPKQALALSAARPPAPCAPPPKNLGVSVTVVPGVVAVLPCSLETPAKEGSHVLPSPKLPYLIFTLLGPLLVGYSVTVVVRTGLKRSGG
jgi:hypothetical protein